MPPKRAPPDMEQLLCAMITLRGLPKGGSEWQEVADLMPPKPDGNKNSAEGARSQWRRLKQKWDEDGIGSDTPPVREDDDEDSGSKKVKPKAKGKGKEKEKVKKTCKRKAKDESEDEDGQGSEEDSDAGINVAVSKKSVRLVKTARRKPSTPLMEESEEDGEEV